MARKKIKIAFINNDSKRKATFKLRRNGLMKKASEISTLCGIDACLIMYSPYETQPDVWPNTLEVQRIVSKFKRMPEIEQIKKMVNHEGFLRQQIVKATEQLNKLRYDNCEKDMTDLMYQCLMGKGLENLMMADLNDLGGVVDKKLNEVNKRIGSLKKGASQQQTVVNHSSAPTIIEMASTSANMQVEKLPTDFSVQTLQNPQWFTDWRNESNTQMNFDLGDEVMMPFHNHQSTVWPGFFFP